MIFIYIKKYGLNMFRIAVTSFAIDTQVIPVRAIESKNTEPMNKLGILCHLPRNSLFAININVNIFYLVEKK